MAEFIVPVIGIGVDASLMYTPEGVGIERYNQWYIGE